MNESAFLTSSRHGVAVRGNGSPITTEDAMHAPDMETGRLLYDDGSTVACRPTAQKTQPGHRVAGLIVSGLDTRWHIRHYFLSVLVNTRTRS